jgi:glucose-6-phosphate 1-dehydrogenase
MAPEANTNSVSVTGQLVGSATEPPLLLRPEDSCAFVIFGASGDLTGRKLIPALYNLACQKLLPPGFAVIGFAVTPMDDASFRESMRDWVSKSPEVISYNQATWDQFAQLLHYITADFERAEGFQELSKRLSKLDTQFGCAENRLWYLATAPSFFGTIVKNLGKYELAESKQGCWSRVVIEKPFGNDLESARQLNSSIHRVFKESQVYRIDHYLGKETVQNLLAFRFANSIIEPIWNRRYIDHVQITAAEQLGVEHRGKYYEQAGCLRDMFQNHLFQIMSLVAMEAPVRNDSQSVRDHKADVLKAVVPIDPEQLGDTVVRGQYGPGIVNGVRERGYRDEPDVDLNSTTETFVAMRLMIDNWRWADVPFYLRSGKRMPKKLTEIAIQFKRVPHMFFKTSSSDEIQPNLLTIRIQPDEGISFRVGAKAPGPQMHIRQVEMNFSYSAAFGTLPATAYETLLLDAMLGDATLFNRNDAVELAWETLTPVIEIWNATKSFTHFPNYAAGAWGPEAADALLVRDGRAWKNE